MTTLDLLCHIFVALYFVLCWFAGIGSDAKSGKYHSVTALIVWHTLTTLLILLALWHLGLWQGVK